MGNISYLIIMGMLAQWNLQSETNALQLDVTMVRQRPLVFLAVDYAELA